MSQKQHCKGHILNNGSNARSQLTTYPSQKVRNINCLKLNPQHSRSTTSLLMKTMEEEHIDIAFVQEPYTYQNKVCGISSDYLVYSFGPGRKRAAIITSKMHRLMIIIAALFLPGPKLYTK